MNTFDDVEQSMQQECEEDIEIAKFYLAHFSPIWGGLGLPREMISKAAGGLVEEYQRAIKELGTVGIHFGPPSGLLDFQKTVDDKKHKITHDDLLNLLEYAKISLMYVKEKNGQWKVFLYRHEIETFYKQHPEEVERDRQKTLELIKEDPALAETLGIKIPE
jgi:hypothetical protein